MSKKLIICAQQVISAGVLKQPTPCLQNLVHSNGVLSNSARLCIVACGSHNTLQCFALHPLYWRRRTLLSSLPSLMDLIANGRASYGILVWLQAFVWEIKNCVCNNVHTDIKCLENIQHQSGPLNSSFFLRNWTIDQKRLDIWQAPDIVTGEMHSTY